MDPTQNLISPTTLQTMSSDVAAFAQQQPDATAQDSFAGVSMNLAQAADTISRQRLTAQQAQDHIALLKLQLEEAQARLSLQAQSDRPMALPLASQAPAASRKSAFRLPSATEFDKFDGSCKTASSAKACQVLTSYFNHIKQATKLHGFRLSPRDPSDFHNHATVATFFASQLHGQALTIFSALSPVEQDMTADEYIAWITKNFQPPFLQYNLSMELHTLQHKSGPLSLLRVKFDQILYYLENLGNTLPVSTQKTLWFNTLQHELKLKHEIFEMAQDNSSTLATLQDRCILLDNFNFAAHKQAAPAPTNKTADNRPRINPPGNGQTNNKPRFNNRFPAHGNPAPAFNAGRNFNYVPANVQQHVPMQVDNIQQQQQQQQQQPQQQQQQQQQRQLNNIHQQQQQQQQQQQRFPKLTDVEKQTYKTNGWCTFCRAKTHTWAECTSPGKAPRR